MAGFRNFGEESSKNFVWQLLYFFQNSFRYFLHNTAGKELLLKISCVIFIFSRFDRAEISKILLQRGADPLIRNDNHLTPLHSAARRGYIELCSLLLKDPRVQASFLNHGNPPPLHMACLSGSREMCELFLKSGVDITSKYSTGFTALHIAAIKGHEEICQLLIETGNSYAFTLNNFGTFTRYKCDTSQTLLVS